VKWKGPWFMLDNIIVGCKFGGTIERLICFNHSDANHGKYFWQLDETTHVWGLSSNQ
jgi:hypothetical protein